MSNSIIKAEKITPIDSPVIKLTLELTYKDAIALNTLCGHIGGHPDGPRSLFDAINEQLNSRGVYRDGRYLNGEIAKMPNSIYFVDTYPF